MAKMKKIKFLSDVEAPSFNGVSTIGGDSIQSDWNQSNETKADYIKNRTHYDNSYYEEFFIEEGTHLDDSNIDEAFSSPFGPNEKWIIELNCSNGFTYKTTIDISTTDNEDDFHGGVYVEIYDTVDGSYIYVEESGSSGELYIWRDNPNSQLTVKFTRDALKQLESKYIPIDHETIVTDDNGKLKSIPTTYTLSKSGSNIILTGSDGTTSQVTDSDEKNVQVDWNQNSIYSKEYIKNRTHYFNSEGQVFFPDLGYNPSTGEWVEETSQTLSVSLLPNTQYEYVSDVLVGSIDVTTDEDGNINFKVIEAEPIWDESIDDSDSVAEFDVLLSIVGNKCTQTIKITKLNDKASDDYIKQNIISSAYLNGPMYYHMDAKYLPIDKETITINADGNLKANQAQADWNQNDETKADYIKNRTHYSKLETEVKTYSPLPGSWPEDRYIQLPENVRSIRFLKFGYKWCQDDDPDPDIRYYVTSFPNDRIELDGLPKIDTIIGTYTEDRCEKQLIPDGDEDFFEEWVVTESYETEIVLTPNGRIYLDNCEVEYEVERETVLKQLGSQYIPLELERGAVEKSLQTPDALALTEDSFAAGTSLAGCRGCYIKAYDFMNKQLFLSKTQVAEPEIAERYIFVSYFKNYEYQVYDDGTLLNPIKTNVKIGDISRGFNIYKTNSKHVSVVYPNIPEEDEGRNRAILFEDWKRTDLDRNQGQTKQIGSHSSIIIQYANSGIGEEYMDYFIQYCKNNPITNDFWEIDDKYHWKDYHWSYFYTINNLHYITSGDTPGKCDATISVMSGNRVTWYGDIGYDRVMPDDQLAFYDYSFMIPDFPNASGCQYAVNLKPMATAIGTGNTTIGRLALTFGNSNTALQDYGFAGGSGSSANYMDFSFGSKNIANGQYGAVIGGKRNVIKRGSHSAAIIGGVSNTIETDAVHSFIAAGNSNKILEGASNAFVAGGCLTANAAEQTVLGRNNAPDGSKLFIIGGGSEDNPKNIFTIDGYGDVIATGSFTAGAKTSSYDTDLTLVTKSYVDELKTRIKTLEDIINNITTLGITKDDNGQLTITE